MDTIQARHCTSGRHQLYFFNGTISGKITDLVENSRIEMTWRLKDWKQGHFAILSLDFLQGAGETTIKVNWTGVPIGQEESLDQF